LLSIEPHWLSPRGPSSTSSSRADQSAKDTLALVWDHSNSSDNGNSGAGLIGALTFVNFRLAEKENERIYFL